MDAYTKEGKCVSHKGPFKNPEDNRGWVVGLEFSNFVHVQYIKNVLEGRWVVKNEKNYVHVVIE